jgi:hypothetical protein
MSETKEKKNATGRDLDREIDALDQQIAALEAEEGRLPPVPTWDDLQSSGAIQELQEQTARRGVLPYLKRSAQIKRLELRLAKEESETAPLRELQEQTYERLEAAQSEKIRAEEKLGEARAAHSDTTMRIQTRETRIRHISAEIQRLRGNRHG